jgi:KUP system potassium uptake protein
MAVIESSAPTPHEPNSGHAAPGTPTTARQFAALTLGALGVVFGDIGTSPLYTLRECLRHGGARVATREDLFGLLSLIFWSLTLVVSLKYLSFVMRADNHGEGGIFAMLAVIPERKRSSDGRVPVIAVVVVVGAALLYGDGAITPAISVLSAIEGLAVAEPKFEHAVVPITCAILFGLFFVQKRGTGAVGRLFGPIMLVWFVTIGVLGTYHVYQRPDVLYALSPQYAVRYFAVHGLHGLLILGSVVLAVTGGEALYADMGHFGLRPIRRAWLWLVMPALVLCYLGQGAVVLRAATAQENPFFAMVPKGRLTLALVALSSAATVIASQALISGAFSLTRQAMQLGYFPRVTVRHTAAHTEGQIYIPQINWMLAIGCLLLVVGFRKSEHLASAYGIAVTGTMLLTSVVYFVVMRRAWNWPLPVALSILVLFLGFDVPFLLANAVKILDGGWVPISIGAGFVAVMLIWSKGRALIVRRYTRRFSSLEEALPRLLRNEVVRVPGTAVFLASSPQHIPPVLVQLVDRGCALHEHICLFTVITEPIPSVPTSRRLEVQRLEHGFSRLIARYGFMEHPDVPALVCESTQDLPLPADPREITYFLGRESLLNTDAGAMGRLAETLYAFLSHNAVSVDRHFKIPPEQVIEIGIQLDL